jgi:hypothetical protein
MEEALTSTTFTRATAVRTKTVAAASVAIATMFVAISIWLDATEDQRVRRLLITVAIIGATALAVFGWFVPRAQSRPGRGRTAIVLSIVALLAAVVAFWLGFAPVLAAGGIVLSAPHWNDPTGHKGQRAAVIIGVLAVIVFCALSLIPTSS